MTTWGGPPWPLHTRLVRELSRTSVGYPLKRAIRSIPRRRGRFRLPDHRRLPDHPVTNVLLISHGDFTTNSGLHAHAIANELSHRGFSPAVAVPGGASRSASFPVISHRDAVRGRLSFPNDRGPDLVHAFSPRRKVMRVTAAMASPYVVHLEDDDTRIIGGVTADERDSFLAGSAGMTVVIDRLLELKPDSVPGAVAWPGFDEAVLSPARPREAVRRLLGVGYDTLVLFYNGNVHESNIEDMRELYTAVLHVREHGVDAVLVKCGWRFVPRSYLPPLRKAECDLGWVERRHIPDLLHAADVLVQPGAPESYNDYRFPSKLPEFLASGRPVVLPRSNVGLHLCRDEEALLLETGDAAEIAERIVELARDPGLRARIGKAGRGFALRELRWSKAVDRIVELYDGMTALPVGVRQKPN